MQQVRWSQPFPSLPRNHFCRELTYYQNNYKVKKGGKGEVSGSWVIILFFAKAGSIHKNWHLPPTTGTTHTASAYIHQRITARSKNSLHEVPDRQSVPPPQLGAAQLGFTAVSSICKILSPSNLRVPNQSVCFSQECMPLFIHLQLVAF